AADNSVVASGSAAKDATTGSIDVSSLTGTGTTFKAQVQTVAPEGELNSGFAESTDTVTRIAGPTGVTLTYDSATSKLNVGWAAVTDNNGYNLQIIDAADNSVVASGSAAKDATTGSIDVSSLTGTGTTFKAQVQTVAPAGKINSGFTESTGTLDRLSAPTISQVTFANNVVSSNWSSVEGASSYQLRISNANKTGESSSTSTSASTSVSGWPAGDYEFTVQALTQAGSLPSLWSASSPVTIGPLSLNNLAKQLKDAGKTSVQTGPILKAAFPDVTALDFAKALSFAGYNSKQTTAALKASFSELTPQQFVAIIKEVFGEETPEQYAVQAKAAGKTGAQTASELKDNFPDITATNMAVAMASAGYTKEETTSGLKAAFPGLSPASFVAAVKAAYGEETPQQYASQAKADGTDGATLAAGLKKNFPNITAQELATAMAGGGYTSQETTAGLKATFPELTPPQFVVIIKRAYPS
ncbi:MAG: hypothetical protein KI790_20020, partial [Cyclobacteriaceae bacterium]|nr:hypothetical protein [Cyclobacteriaceae bacterium HetDA_MAG_MS6]